MRLHINVSLLLIHHIDNLIGVAQLDTVSDAWVFTLDLTLPLFEGDEFCRRRFQMRKSHIEARAKTAARSLKFR